MAVEQIKRKRKDEEPKTQRTKMFGCETLMARAFSFVFLFDEPQWFVLCGGPDNV